MKIKINDKDFPICEMDLGEVDEKLTLSCSGKNALFFVGESIQLSRKNALRNHLPVKARITVDDSKNTIVLESDLGEAVSYLNNPSLIPTEKFKNLLDAMGIFFKKQGISAKSENQSKWRNSIGFNSRPG